MYELAELDHEIIEGQPTEKFWREFPTGRVPVMETRHLMPMHDSPWQALMDTLIVFEYESKRTDLSDVPAMRQHAYRTDSYEDQQAWMELVLRALAEGRSLRSVINAAGASSEILDRITGGARKRDADWCEVWDYAKEHPHIDQVCEHFPQVPRIRMRGFLEHCHLVPTRDEILQRARALRDRDCLSYRKIAYELQDVLRQSGWSDSLIIDKMVKTDRAENKRQARRATHGS